MRQVHVAFGFIQQGDNFLLQLRNGDPRIGGAGLIGCFGGKIDEGEDPLDTFCREVMEETGFKVNPKDVKKLGIVKVESDHNLEPVEVMAHVFHWNYDGAAVPEIKEGELVMMTKREALADLGKMTTGTRAAFKELL